MKRVRAWLVQEDGNAAAAAVFALAAAALVSGMVASGANAIQFTGASRVLNATSFAVDSRFELWTTAMDAGGPAGTDSICFKSENTCVSITGIVESGGRSFVTLQAVNGERTMSRTRAY